jgi:hypothetical protein
VLGDLLGLEFGDIAFEKNSRVVDLEWISATCIYVDSRCDLNATANQAVRKTTHTAE